MPAFVISTGRCGSTLLSSMLRLHPALLSLSEVFTFLDHEKVLSSSSRTGTEFWRILDALPSDILEILQRERVREILRDQTARGGSSVSPLSLVTLPHLTDQADALLVELAREVSSWSAAPARAHLARLFDWLAARQGRTHWIERSGGSVEYGAALAEAWPQARWIVLVRDGCETAFSMSRHPFFRVRVARLVARDQALSVSECLRRQLSVHHFGFYWSALMVQLERFIKDLNPDRTLVVRYDELLSDPQRLLRGINTFLDAGTDAHEWLSEAGALARISSTNWRMLAASEQQLLERACRPGNKVFDRLAASADYQFA